MKYQVMKEHNRMTIHRVPARCARLFRRIAARVDRVPRCQATSTRPARIRRITNSTLRTRDLYSEAQRADTPNDRPFQQTPSLAEENSRSIEIIRMKKNCVA